MFDFPIRIWARSIAAVATIDGKANYPRDEHAVPVPLYIGGTIKAASAESNVTPLRGQVEVRHG